VNVNENVNVTQDVSVAVEAVVVFVVVASRLAWLDEKDQFLHEESVRDITEALAVR
jgi:hypothetical protein